MSNAKPKKRSQPKFQKPTQPIYRPPSARIDPGVRSETMDYRLTTNSSEILGYGNLTTNAFPIKGVLKRSKSFGNNNKSSSEYGPSLLDETSTGRFLLSMEGLSWENLSLIKQALDRNTCTTLSMTQLLQIIRILCNKVMEKSINSKMIARVCLEIHYRQQENSINTKNGENRFLFLESLANCLREWFNERDKLRFTTGGARRWTAYIFFIMEVYLNLKETTLESISASSGSRAQSHDSSAESAEESNDNSDVEDEEMGRTFVTSDLSRSSESSSKSESPSIENLLKQTDINIENKIMSSLHSKQQKQFSSLLFDSFHVILSNPNSTPAEIECMQTVFRKCGKYLEQDNPQRTKSLLFTIRDTLLNCSTPNQFINANNSSSNQSSITKNLLEIIELAASGWDFTQPQQIYYFPYTKVD